MSSPTHNTVGFSSFSPFGTGAPVMYGTKWNDGGGAGVTLTYSFPGAPNAYYPPSGYGTGASYGGAGEFAAYKWSSLTTAERNGVVAGLQAWHAVAVINFIRVNDSQFVVGDLRFAGSTTLGSNANAHAYYPGAEPWSGDVWFNFNSGFWHGAHSSPIVKGTYDYLTIIHEIGHALGLKHPFANYPNILGAAFDNYSFTIMSYQSYANSGSNGADFYPTTPMWYDLIAIQAMYGARPHASGNTVYTFSASKHYWQTIDDSGGVDTIVYVGGSSSKIDLNIGHWNDLGLVLHLGAGGFHPQSDTVMIGPRSLIEHATGGNGADRIIGNGIANRLIGNDGNDVLSGGAGRDAMNGGQGNDRLTGGTGADVVRGAAGVDRFYFVGGLGPSNVDTLPDYDILRDYLYIDRSFFPGLTVLGTLPGYMLYKGAAAHDADDRFVYQQWRGYLYYDHDGHGGDPGILIAKLPGHPNLSNFDFVVVA